MSYINIDEAKQIIVIAKNHIGSTTISVVDKEANGCYIKGEWDDLLCLYELYRIAGHRIEDLIETSSYQKIITKLLSKIGLTPSYSLGTSGGNVITVNGSCGCDGGGSTTGPVSGCKDSTISFILTPGSTTFSNPALIGVEILLVTRQGVGMSSYSGNINGYIYDSVTGTFVANAPASPSGEEFVILYRDCNVGGGTPVPPTGLRTGNYTIAANGVLTQFDIPHGGTTTPTWWDVQAAEAEAIGIIAREPYPTFIRIYYDVAPVSGTHLLTYAAR